ncbi:MAG TPA: glycosyltransferase family A protein [Chitinophagaceae bacterium]|nr:glycosyltransferase family A protein [Chitinophagaceae bacterium]
MSFQPLVSILMTAYNRDRYIAAAIESVLKLSYQNWELVIVDDGSADKTVAIAKEYAAKDNRISVYINERNLGDYPNRNRAASYARGAYLQYLDSDDTIFDYTLSKMLELAAQYPDTGIFMRSTSDFIRYFTSYDALERHFFEHAFLNYGPGGTFLSREFFNRIGGYPEKYGPANDMYFNLKAACNGPVVIHPYRTNFYRIHDEQESKKEYIYLIENFRYMRDALNELPLPFTKEKIKWLRKKNYRRFVVNLFHYLKKTGNYRSTVHAWRSAGFKLGYLLQGIFH